MPRFLRHNFQIMFLHGKLGYELDNVRLDQQVDLFPKMYIKDVVKNFYNIKKNKCFIQLC